MSGNLELKKKVEALLFATQGLSISKISEVIKVNEKDVVNILNELKEDYQKRDSAFTIDNTGDIWKLTIHSEQVPLVKNLIPSEFPKSLLETLAVIAWKNPANQSDVIKVRGNKAYNHIKFLEEAGLISGRPIGKTRELKLTDKFYEYFNVEPDDIKKRVKL